MKKWIVVCVAAFVIGSRVGIVIGTVKGLIIAKNELDKERKAWADRRMRNPYWAASRKYCERMERA